MLWESQDYNVLNQNDNKWLNDSSWTCNSHNSAYGSEIKLGLDPEAGRSSGFSVQMAYLSDCQQSSLKMLLHVNLMLS